METPHAMEMQTPRGRRKRGSSSSGPEDAAADWGDLSAEKERAEPLRRGWDDVLIEWKDAKFEQVEEVEMADFCTGMASPAMALQGLKVRHRYHSASDTKKSSRQFVKDARLQSPPEHFYESVHVQFTGGRCVLHNKQCAQEMSAATPLHIWVGGTPCQDNSERNIHRFEDEHINSLDQQRCYQPVSTFIDVLRV
jgi:hypothetical protein